MKVKIFFFNLAMLLCCNASFSQKMIENHWGLRGYDEARAVAATNDGGYIVAGLTKSHGDTNGDIIVIKLDNAGDTTWTLLVASPYEEGGNAVMQTEDGNYLVTGHTEGFGSEDCDLYIMKVDKNGKFLWLRHNGGLLDDVGCSTLELPDGGGYITTGFTASFGNNLFDLYLVKSTILGDTLWTKHLGGSGINYGYSIAPMAEGSFLVAGFTNRFGNGNDNAWLLKFNANGDTVWTRVYKSQGDKRFYQILQTPDKGYILAGYDNQTPTGTALGIVVKLDENGNNIWQKTYGGLTDNTTFYGITVLPNGYLLATGICRVSDPKGNAVVFTIDPGGNQLSRNLYGGSGSFATCIAQQSSNSWLIAGLASKYGDPAGDLYCMEMDSLSTGITPYVPNKQLVSVYPDPVTNISVMQLPISVDNGSYCLQLTNIRGEVVFSTPQFSGQQVAINKNGLPSGLYMYRLVSTSGNFYMGKIIIE